MRDFLLQQGLFPDSVPEAGFQLPGAQAPGLATPSGPAAADSGRLKPATAALPFLLLSPGAALPGRRGRIPPVLPDRFPSIPPHPARALRGCPSLHGPYSTIRAPGPLPCSIFRIGTAASGIRGSLPGVRLRTEPDLLPAPGSRPGGACRMPLTMPGIPAVISSVYILFTNIESYYGGDIIIL